MKAMEIDGQSAFYHVIDIPDSGEHIYKLFYWESVPELKI